MTNYIIKFSLIALCFLIALCSRRFARSKEDWAYLVAAMGLTLIADYFLVLAHNHRAGVFVFCFVHMVYILRVSINRKETIRKIVSICAKGAIVLTLAMFLNLDILIVLTVIYAGLFIKNLVTHFKYCRFNRRLILTGLILFALCDIHVLMFNLPRYIPAVPLAVAEWGRFWIWVFYTPAQFLLSLSAADMHLQINPKRL